MRLRINYIYCLLLFFVISEGFAQKKALVPNPASSFTLPPGVSSKDYRPGIIIVKFKPEISGATKVQAAVSTMANARITGASILSVTKKFNDPAAPNAETGTLRAAENPLNRIYEVKFSGQADIVTVIKGLLTQGTLEYAEPDYIYHHYFVPNDPRYTAGNQSYLDVVKAPQAWDLIRNASSVTIGIVDSGSDLTHEDLSANIALNPADPVNGIDDDKDGYIDNFQGWDFVGLSASAIKEDNDPNVKSDTTEHGVHVSGIAGAVSNNAKGVASIAFSTKLLIVKCGPDNDGELIVNGYSGIKYAVDHGAQIVNCSWGGSAGGSFGQDIINYAVSKGVLVIAAAGNDNNTVLSYPAAYAGVLAVAAVSNTDVKSSFSSYGTYVGISAPGNSVLSTFPRSLYGTLSGTSMSTPVVASAAALLKAYYPALSMSQIGEQLRATADNIDTKNPAFAGRLGKGRVNIFRALTESPPAVRYQKITLADKGNGSIPPGDTLTVYFDLKNILLPVTGLRARLTTSSGVVTVTASDQTIASLGTGETKTLVGPFKVYVKPTAADNTAVLFKLEYTGNNGTYVDSESFTITVAVDYINVEVNKIATTFTSNGRVGYSLPNTLNGLGFVYKNQNLLYEAGLMIGLSGTQLSDNVRTGTGGSNEHFVKKVRAVKVSPSTAAFEARSEFDDSGNAVRLPVYVKHKQIAFASAPDDKYSIAEYEVSNPGSTALTGVYIGLFTDWDVDAGTNNVTKFDPADRVAYIFAKPTNSLYCGVKLLSTIAPPLYYPISYQVQGDPTFGGLFTQDEKYLTLSSGVKAASLGENVSAGYDVMFTSGYGPCNIPAGGSVKVAFAFMAGDNLADLTATAAAAQTRYNILNPPFPIDKFFVRQNYPNPVSTSTTIEYAVPGEGKIVASLYDLTGKKVHTYLNETVSAGAHSFTISATDLTSGLYICRVRYNNQHESVKVLVAR